MLNLEKLEKKLGLKFQDRKLLKLVFIHRSYKNENSKIKEHNERLEFLGDAVLELLASEKIYKTYPKMNEGEMTQVRSALVNTESLAKHSHLLGLEEYLKMAKGEKQSKKGRDHILANTFEALIGAIYLEFGLEKAREFLENNLFGYLEEILDFELFRDPKSYLQELSQDELRITPTYKIHEETGPEHDKKYISGAYVGKYLLAEGEGSSKKKAEIDAAKNALEYLKDVDLKKFYKSKKIEENNI